MPDSTDAVVPRDSPDPGEVTKVAAVAELDRRRALAEAHGGPERVAAHRARGRLPVRERVALLVDGGDRFVEVGKLALSDRPEIGERAPADACVTGIGDVGGRKVGIVANDATVLAGSTGHVAGRKQGQILSFAAHKGYPIVCLGDANGGRLPDMLGSDFTGALSTAVGGEIFLGVSAATVRVPRATAILGNAYGDPALWTGLSDFVVMSEGASIALSGPSLVGSAIGAATSHDDLGGPDMTVRTTGVVSRLEKTEADAITALRDFLSYLPSNAALPAPRAVPVPPQTPGEMLYDIVPDRGRRGYDVRKVVDAVADAGSFFEIHAEWARNLVVGLARVEGAAVGVIANQPKFRGGVLDADAASKALRFVDLCDGFGLPMVFLQDLPGVMIGIEAERSAVVQKLMALYALIARSPVPKVTVVLRKAFGFGYIAFGGPPLGTDYVVSWPNAEIGFMSASNAVAVLHHQRLLAAARDHGEGYAADLAGQLEAETHSSFAPWNGAASVAIHDVIRPEDTRQAVIDGLYIADGYR